MSRDPADHFDSLADEFARALRAGEAPEIEAYVDSNPQLEEEIRRLFPVLQMMESQAAERGVPNDSEMLRTEMNQLVGAPPRRKLGEYRIIREIGRGGMGIVYEAEQESLGRRVALKLLPDSARFDQRRIQRFQQEARASGMLHHTNIVPVFGVGRENDVSYFIMQFIEGSSLDQVIQELRAAGKLRPAVDKSLHETDRAWDTHANHPKVAVPDWGTPPGQSTPGEPSHVEPNEPSLQPAAGSDKPNSSNAPQSPMEVPPDSDDRFPSNERPHSLLASASGASFSNVSSLSGTGPGRYRNIAKIGLQVSDALQYAHSKNILHRDIKPANLLIEDSGQVWVTDFGLAKLLGNDDLTKTGETVGTLRYLPPEQFNGHSDARSDVYSLGLTLYELLTLQPAFSGKDFAQLVQNVTDSAPIPPRKREPRIPRDLETIVLKAIAKSPDQRYQTAAALHEDLERFLSGKPISAKQSSEFDRVVKAIKRRPIISALSALLLISLIAGSGLVTWKWRQATASLTVAQDEAESRQAINDFLLLDLLAYAQPDQEPDPDIRLRTVLDRAAANVGERFQGKPLLESEIRISIGRIYTQLSRHRDAREHFEIAYQLRTQELGLEAPDTWFTYQLLATSEQDLGNWKKAKSMLDEILAYNESHFGTGSKEVAEVQLNLAQVLASLGRLNEAQRLLEAYNQVAPQFNFLDDFEGQLKLARVFLDQGKLEIAEAQILKTIARLDQVLVDDQGEYRFSRKEIGRFHQFLDAQNLRALILLDQGFPEKSLEIEKQAYDHCQRLLGPDHDKTLSMATNLAGVLIQLEQYERAAGIMLDVVARSEKTAGPNHPMTLARNTSYAITLVNTAQFENALAILHKNYDLESERLGEKHPTCITLGFNLASCYFRDHQYEEAEKWATTVYNNARETMGLDHAITINALADLGSVHQRLKKNELAEKELLESLAASRRTMRNNHPHLLTTLNNLVEFYIVTERYDLAKPLGEEALEGYELELGPDAWQTLASKNLLGHIYDMQKKYDQAFPLYLDVYTQKARQDPGSRSNALLLFALVEVEHKLKKHELIVEQLEAFCEVSGAMSPPPISYYRAQSKLGRAELELGYYDAAESHLLDAFDGLKPTEDETEPPSPSRKKELRLTANRLMELYRRREDESARKVWRETYRTLKTQSHSQDLEPAN